jgi:hypothetical protein
MNIPRIRGIDTALTVYYTHSEIGNKEIIALFGSLSSATVSRLKKMVKAEMSKRGVYSYAMYKVNTAVAYDVFGIDVKDLEKRRRKLKELEL